MKVLNNDDDEFNEAIYGDDEFNEAIYGSYGRGDALGRLLARPWTTRGANWRPWNVLQALDCTVDEAIFGPPGKSTNKNFRKISQQDNSHLLLTTQ